MSTKIVCGIKGLAPGMLMHRFPLETIEAMDKKPKEEQAEIAAYRNEKTQELYVPSDAVFQTLVNAAVYSKGKGRASLQKPTAACVSITPAHLGLGTDKYEIDSRPAVNPPTGGRIVRHRPHFPEWEIEFNIEFDENLLKEEQVRKIVDNGGSLVGLLDYRPDCKGPFGRFVVTKWAVVSRTKSVAPPVEVEEEEEAEEAKA